MHVLGLHDPHGSWLEDTAVAGDPKALEHAKGLERAEAARANERAEAARANEHAEAARDNEHAKDLDRTLLAVSQRRLAQLAARAQRFTPRVSVVPPDGLLLEVKGSLHLFNGVEGLLHALEIECRAIGVKPALALTPTPLAAIVVARSGKPFVLTNTAQLVGRLSPLPLTPLRWPPAVLERLARIGIRTIGQVLRLPRAGFARRFGAAQLAELDRLTGRSADPRQYFQAPERFRRRRELTYELEDSEGILAALRPLLADLGKFLQARQCGVMQLECQLRHRHAPVTRCLLRLAAPLADVARLTELLGERLSALALPEPVRSCELRSGPLVLRTLASASLWQPGEHGGSHGAESPQLIELLRARLGPQAVYGLQILRAHRPESTWSEAEPGSQTELQHAVRPERAAAPRRAATPEPAATSDPAVRPGRPAQARSVAAPKAHPGEARSVAAKHEPTPLAPYLPWAAFRRPLWLLHAPQLLEDNGGMPVRRGPLRLSAEVECIETGWWDGGGIGRDYYTAFDIYGVQLWIFRERAVPHRWFLHGVFG